MQDLYSLDLSFCTRVTISSIFTLLEIRGNTLAELRLNSCRKLEIARDPHSPPVQRGQYNGGQAGRQILNALRSHGCSCCLSVLDVRHCGGQSVLNNKGYPPNDPFVQGMANLEFEQKLPGFFARPARWNPEVKRRLIGQILAQRAAPEAAGAENQ
jgi:hypothetical protein